MVVKNENLSGILLHSLALSANLSVVVLLTQLVNLVAEALIIYADPKKALS